MLGLGVFVDRALAALRHPDPVNIGIALVVAVGVTGLGVLAKRRFGEAAVVDVSNASEKAHP